MPCLKYVKLPLNPATSNSLGIDMNLAQAYEAEFSKIMTKQPNQDGLFALDTELGGDVTGYLLLIDEVPAGFTAIAEQPVACFEVCDFYIVPYFRKNKLGRNFITALFAELGGSWQIKQVAGADYAVKFWREVIGHYTQQQFVEDSYQDSKWGRVTRQQFNHH